MAKGHFIGKIVLNSLIGVTVADVDMYGRTVKCLVVPMKDNGIKEWNGELQLWFRAFRYREQKGRFSHFLMKYIPIRDVKRLSANQLETFANHSIGAMMRSDEKEENENINTKEDFITENL